IKLPFATTIVHHGRTITLELRQAITRHLLPTSAIVHYFKSLLRPFTTGLTPSSDRSKTLTREYGWTWDLIIGHLWIVNSDLDSRVVPVISSRQLDGRWVGASAAASDRDLGASHVELRPRIVRCGM